MHKEKAIISSVCVVWWSIYGGKNLGKNLGNV